MCVVYMCVCGGGGGGGGVLQEIPWCVQAAKTLESVRSLQSALFCADFYNNKFFIARLLGA